MNLDTMTPDPAWNPEDWTESLARLRSIRGNLTVRIWCGDWCGDCRRLLPPFAAALDAIDLPEDAVMTYGVEKLGDGSKVGDGVDEYGIERTPTVVLEIGGEEVARFEEGRTPGPILESLADQLAGIEHPTS